MKIRYIFAFGRIMNSSKEGGFHKQVQNYDK